MTSAKLLDLSYLIHPMPCDRTAQGDKVTVTEIKSGIVHSYDLRGFASKSNSELDEMYTSKFNRDAWHLTREAYIIALSKI